jgi:hypothetical protein
MTAKEAVAWLRQVDGEVYRTPPARHGREAWVAVVRTPRSGLHPARTIVALGETLEEAARAAATQWRESFRGLGPLH